MKKIFLFVFAVLTSSVWLLSSHVTLARAAGDVFPAAKDSGTIGSIIGGIDKMIVPISIPAGTTSNDWYLSEACAPRLNVNQYLGGGCSTDAAGNVYSPGVLGIQQKAVAMLYENQISSREYVADLLNNIGIPTISRAYAQGTGYAAMSPFLEFWKVFRNLAYSLYIVMFVVIGVMIMLRTKVNAQTIITIQTALPNLLITLILITFSYAIVGFMIDLMYFLIYFIVYLISSVGIIKASDSIKHLMTSSAWSVIFTGRWGIISAISTSIGNVLWNLGTGGIGVAGQVISMVSPMFLIVAVAFVIAMFKLMLALVQAYVMLIVQTITAPVQILMNAMPGSKAFSNWLKKTASYLIPFPVAAGMFIFSAILVGSPKDRTYYSLLGTDNPFGVNENAAIYQNRDGLWLPPFTLTDAALAKPGSGSADILTIIGFVIFLMTPSAVKMAQEWLQVKESPYASEATQGFLGVVGTGVGYGTGFFKQTRALKEQRAIQEYGASRYADKMAEEMRKRTATEQNINQPVK